VTDIAELAKNLFGEVGAIQVFDDLHRSASSSWELFNTLPPFYIRGKPSRQSGLKIEIERIDSTVDDTAVPPQAGLLKKFFGSTGKGPKERE